MQDIKRLAFTAILLIAITFMRTASAEFIVKTIYFQPTNAAAFADVQDKISKLSIACQELYASEMDRHGFGEKTYRLEKDGDNNVRIHHVVGKHAADHYVLKTSSKVFLELPDKLNPTTPPGNKKDVVQVIIVGGITHINGNSWGIGWPYHSGRYGGTGLMAGASPHLSVNIIFHELRHCFGLYHQENGKSGTLEHYEARWLSKHYHFNNTANNFTFPKPVNMTPTITNSGDNLVRFELELTSEIGLYQAQIFRDNDLVVIGWDYLNGKDKDTAMFEVKRDKWTPIITFQVMDTRGNHRMVAINVALPPPEESKPKNPDLNVALDTNGLVGAWLMDDGNGRTITDSSDNGLDAKVFQGNPKWVKGKFGSALEFGGADMVAVADDTALDLKSFTLSAWVNIPKISGKWQIIASKENRNPIGRNYGLFSHIHTGVIHYSFTTGNWKSFDAKTVITDGKWHHIVTTYEKPNFKLYVDGKLDAQTALNTDPDNHDNFLFIGGCNIGDYWMTGTIDEIVLYNRALSDVEINELMDKSITGTLGVKPGGKLVTMWGQIKTDTTQ